MKRKVISGQEASEFVLVASLVFFAALFVVIIFGNKLSTFFTEQSSAVAVSKVKKELLTQSSKEKYLPDYFEPIEVIKKGTLDEPSRTCKSGKCKLDFGDFNLNTLDDLSFNKAVKTTGSSGGTLKVVNTLDQIVSILNSQGKTEEADQVKALSVMGHNLAVMEEQVENLVVGCKGDRECINSKVDKVITKPEQFDESVMPFKNQSYESFIGSLDWASYHKTNDPDTYNKLLENNIITAKILEQVDQVQNNTKIDKALSGMVRELAWNMITMAENLEGNYCYVAKGEKVQAFSEPLSGKYMKEEFEGDPYENFKNYSASSISNFNASLICAAAKEEKKTALCH